MSSPSSHGRQGDQRCIDPPAWRSIPRAGVVSPPHRHRAAGCTAGAKVEQPSVLMWNNVECRMSSDSPAGRQAKGQSDVTPIQKTRRGKKRAPFPRKKTPHPRKHQARTFPTLSSPPRSSYSPQPSRLELVSPRPLPAATAVASRRPSLSVRLICCLSPLDTAAVSRVARGKNHLYHVNPNRRELLVAVGYQGHGAAEQVRPLTSHPQQSDGGPGAHRQGRRDQHAGLL